MDKTVFPFGLGRPSTDDASALADSVVNQLETALTVGLINDGDKLPPEIELAAEMGVSTVTLRQALSMLRNKGIIETRRGRGGGSYVRDSSAFSRERVEEHLRTNSIGLLRDLGDAAAAAAGSAARLAALRALPEDVERLTRFAHEFSVATQSNVCRRADSRFHIEIGVAAQSPRLTLSILQLQGESSPLLWAPGTLLTDQSAQEHALIVEAIKNRDEQRAQMLSVEHCEREAKVLIEHHLRLATAEQRGGYRV
ncbi:FadR/GntR family transcriptional regulator [Zafaria sp. Z1313]|uniref:FadR/GntR family transcriptional regulator n=1 Tax=unclassified Zafaria TaxID=2828765 RepID=UPI002E7A360F|nr:GntR family transcriptional regulator [Zafaria sp. J156]MEE1622693.1 GntR family transcriptional regulator [Zafaria sp. J156]